MDYSLMTTVGAQTIIPSASVPAAVLAAVKAKTAESAIGVAGFVRNTEQVIKAEVMTFNTRSLLQLENAAAPFIAIAAKDLFIEVPPRKEEVARIVRAPESMFGDLTGGQGGPGPSGTNTGQADGATGGNGGPGLKGHKGGTTTVPDLYIFFDRITTGTGNPATGGLLSIVATGVAGGVGGKGGKGGDGGSGNQGTESSSSGAICNAGPGRGGNGGQAGSGGPGGDGGTGGRGGSVFLVGPKSEWSKAGFFEVIQGPGKYGQPGEPGDPPPRQNSCRLERTITPGAAMKDSSGSIRTGIQGQSGSQVAGAGERSGGSRCA